MFLVYAFISECFPLTAPENQVLYRGLCSLWIVFYAGWEICILFNCYTCRHLFSLAIFIKEVCLSCMCFWPPHQYMNVCTYVSLYQNWTICLFYAYTILLCFFFFCGIEIKDCDTSSTDLLFRIDWLYNTSWLHMNFRTICPSSTRMLLDYYYKFF